MAAIAYWCVTRHVPAIESQIKANADAAVFDVSARDIETTVQGRTVILKGSVANENKKTELISALNAAAGVRHVVDDQVNVIESVAAAPADDTPQTESIVTVGPTDNPTSNEQTQQTANAETTPGTTVAESPSAQAPSPDNTTPEAPPSNAPSPGAPTAEAPAADAPAGPAVQTPASDSPTPEAPAPNNSAPEAPATPIASSDTATQAPEAPASETLTPEPEPAAPQTQSPETPVTPNTNPSTSVADTAGIDNDQPTVGEIAELAVVNESAPSNPSNAPSPDAQEPSSALVDVLEEGSSSFSMQIKDGTLTLSGDISNEDESLAFIQSAMRTFDVNYVVNSMQVNEENSNASWLPALTEFIPSMQPIANARINIFESQVTLSGTAPSEQTHDEIIDKALSLLSELSLVDSINISSDNTAPSPEPEIPPTSDPVAGTTSQEATPISTQPASQTGVENTKTTAAELNTLREAFAALEKEKILFRSGSDVLTEQSVQTVSAMSALLSTYSDINIEIDGHTDSLGSSEENLQLSQLRANAVRDLMIEKGIARERLSAYGFGDGVPIADNGTADGRKLNRRIEFNF